MAARDRPADTFLAGPVRLNRQPLPHQIADLLRERIVHDDIKPGERIREEVLSRVLSVSRTPLRDALRILELDGLVEIVPNRGAAVVDFPPERVRGMRQVQARLEGLAGRTACDTATAAELAELGALLPAMTGGDPRAALEAEEALYAGIVAAARNRVLAELHGQLQLMLRRSKLLSAASRPALDHAPVLGAIAARRHEEVERLIWTLRV